MLLSAADPGFVKFACTSSQQVSVFFACGAGGTLAIPGIGPPVGLEGDVEAFLRGQHAPGPLGPWESRDEHANFEAAFQERLGQGQQWQFSGPGQITPFLQVG